MNFNGVTVEGEFDEHVDEDEMLKSKIIRQAPAERPVPMRFIFYR